MSEAEAIHKRLTQTRVEAYNDLFGDKPDAAFPAHQLRIDDDDPFLIDVFLYSFEIQGTDGLVYAAVTNGMSDQRMVEGDHPDQPRRRELLQYFRECTPAHAKRLRTMAWIPLYEEFLLDSHHTIAWKRPAVEGTPWKNALFLLPMLRSHQAFAMEVDGDETSFLWHIPISDAEHAYRKEHGVDGLLDRMQEVKLPWIFEESNRPHLVEG